MESSFFEYRDQSGLEVESDSDTNIIEDSFLEDSMPKTPMRNNHTDIPDSEEDSALEDLMPKTPMRNNHTFIPDSEESLVYDGSEEERDTPQAPKPIARRSITEKHVVGSSDDDGSEEERDTTQAPKSIARRSITEKHVAGSSDDDGSEEERDTPQAPKSIARRSITEKHVAGSSDDGGSEEERDTPQAPKSIARRSITEKHVAGSSDDGGSEEERDTPQAPKSIARCSITEKHVVGSSDDGGSEEERDTPQAPKSIARRSITEKHVVGSSDDDASRQSSRKSQNMPSSDVAISSDEGEVSPELVPKRRPPTRPKSLNSTTDSPILRRVKKRMVLLDSDTDNSIIIEKNKTNKMKCLKDTPLKIDGGNDGKINDSEEDVDIDASHEDMDDHETLNNHGKNYKVSDSESDSHDEAMDDDYEGDETDDDGPDEEQMVMSRATRMSIMGIIPKQNESDESDFIESDDSVKRSIGGSTGSLTDLPAIGSNVTILLPETAESDTDLPEVNLTCRMPLKLKTPVKSVTPTKQKSDNENSVQDSDNDDSVLTCSPIASPLRDVTNEFDNSVSNSPTLPSKKTPKTKENKALKDKVLKNLIANDLANKNTKSYYDGEVTVIDENKPYKRTASVSKNNYNSYYNGEVTVVEDSLVGATRAGKSAVKELKDDGEDVTVIDSAPEVIMLSSDEEEELNPPKAAIKTSPKPKAEKRDNTIKQYLPPPSYPNQVVFVRKHVLDNELSKLNGMQADLHNIRNLLDNMDVSTLPDGGSKLFTRRTELEAAVRRQGDRVGNMVVEPSQPTPGDVARDGFDQGLSWDDLQKAGNAVQPRMFGKQAMSTHLAERNLILDRLRDLHSALDSRPSEDEQAPNPAAMKTSLMPHQKHALAWLRWREALKPHGGILADDMGLGKTITMISLIASDREIGSDDEESDDDYGDELPKGKLTKGGTLVVCPASLMTQWEEEVKKHCLPHRVTTCLHHGASRATQPQRLAHTDIVLTTYNLLQRDCEKDGVLMRVMWRRAILDEAHIVRNHKSATSRAVRRLRARRRWALTGTPLHNKDLDLFALLQFLRCAPFDELPMWKKWIDNKSQGGQERLSTIMRCIMLRRTKVQLQAKGQLKDLPARTAHQCLVTLTKEEMNVYQKVLVFSKTLFAQFLHQRAEKDADGGFLPREKKDSAYYEMHKKMIALQGAKPVKAHEILVLLLRLRQVCCHCGLIAAMLDPEDTAGLHEDEAGKDLLAELNKLSLNESKDDKEKDVAPEPEEGTTAAEAIRSVLSPNNPVFQLTKRSSKIKAVMDCLKENVLVNKGEKAVVVSQWTSVLSLVEAELKQERVKSVTLSGSVAVPARAALVNALNDPKSDVRIMLLSLCAGGVGLNLCGASHLLLLDPHWNPQLEEQAQDRVYRVGQLRPVHVYRFMCVDTVEQSIRKLQDAKLQMAANVLTGARHTSASKLSIEDLKVLFNMGPAPEPHQ